MAGGLLSVAFACLPSSPALTLSFLIWQVAGGLLSVAFAARLLGKHRTPPHLEPSQTFSHFPSPSQRRLITPFLTLASLAFSFTFAQGGIDEASLSDEAEFLEPDADTGSDSEAAEYVFRQCQELGVGIVVLTRFAAEAAPLHGFIFDQLATTGHPVGMRMRDQVRCALPSPTHH